MRSMYNEAKYGPFSYGGGLEGNPPMDMEARAHAVKKRRQDSGLGIPRLLEP